MAFGLSRWLIAVLACSALVAFVFLPPEGRDPREPEWVYFTSQSLENRLRDYLRLSQLRLYQLEVRDSILALASGGVTATERQPLLVVQGGLPQVVEDTARALTEEPFAAIRNKSPKSVAVVAIAARETAEPWMYWTSSIATYYLPAATDGETCVVAHVPERGLSERYWLRAIDAAARTPAILGPCAYYAAFGRPGFSIEEWLEATDFDAAMSPVWIKEGQPLERLSPDEARWFGRTEGGGGWFRRDYLPLNACAAGNRQVCRSSVLAPSVLPWYYLLWPGSRRERGIVGREYRRLFPRLGPNSERLLSDLLVDMGDERFGRFWSSEAEVETAFAEAFGVELADWVMDWARAQVITVESPGPAVSSAVLSALLVAVFVGGTTFLVRGRQVS